MPSRGARVPVGVWRHQADVAALLGSRSKNELRPLSFSLGGKRLHSAGHRADAAGILKALCLQ
jgi:hypothetical protein